MQLFVFREVYRTMREQKRGAVHVSISDRQNQGLALIKRLNIMQTGKKIIFSILLMLLSGIISLPEAEARQLTEKEKIEYLISHVESLPGAVFIRNGSSHTPAEAASHLRTKLRSRRSVSTAEEFIHQCATQSSITGRKYIISFSDGRSYEAGSYLRKVLDELKNEEDEISD